jgi:CDP-2,3-bis-(O-geranylgeranyl)-sn-glycerol synthase
MRNLLGNRLNAALDFGSSFVDGRPIFGKSKTWRGVASALVFTAVAGAILGYTPIIGLLVAGYTVMGDLLSSFTKRRLGMAPSSMAPLIDQVPEALLPAVMLRHSFNLDAIAIMILVCVFVVVELILSFVLFKLGIRNRPY